MKKYGVDLKPGATREAVEYNLNQQLAIIFASLDRLKLPPGELPMAELAKDETGVQPKAEEYEGCVVGLCGSLLTNGEHKCPTYFDYMPPFTNLDGDQDG